ncbi:MAG: Uma2 family endonuclease [Acidobacteriota bacterium]
MSTSAASYLEAVEHLPDGAMLRLEHISWDEYEHLLEELSEWPGVRVSYDHGRVEIMSPLPEHEEYKDFIYSMVRILAEEINLSLETRGSTTFKRKGDLKGAEPDASFYVQNAGSLVGNRRIDLDVDPPPDIVVEVDITNESLSKFPIYAAFGVLEIWRYNGQQARIYHLLDRDYVEASASRSFHGLTAQAITDFVELSKTEGQSKALTAFRQWVGATMHP